MALSGQRIAAAIAMFSIQAMRSASSPVSSFSIRVKRDQVRIRSGCITRSDAVTAIRAPPR